MRSNLVWFFLIITDSDCEFCVSFVEGNWLVLCWLGMGISHKPSVKLRVPVSTMLLSFKTTRSFLLSRILQLSLQS